MCSRADRDGSPGSRLPGTPVESFRPLLLACAVTMAALSGMGWPTAAAGGEPPPEASTPRPVQSASRPPLAAASVASALQMLRQDANLHGTERTRRLRLREFDQPEASADSRWLENFVAWLDDSARMLLWLAGLVTVAVAAVLLPRWWRRWDARQAMGAVDLPPSHVQALDIRPDSLPDDIGSAAADHWRRGEHRAALSLLYRGALSRLVHGHAVPIRASSTEQECLALARPRLEPAAADFVETLIRLWLASVYAGSTPREADVMSVCSGFATHLPLPAAGPRS